MTDDYEIRLDLLPSRTFLLLLLRRLAAVVVLLAVVVVLVGADINELTGLKQELIAQARAMNEDLTQMTSDLHQVPAIRSEIEGVKQELQRARAAIEYEKKGYAQNYVHGQLIENKLLSTARELEKLRFELANADKGVHHVAAYGYQGSGYNAGYRNFEAAYAGNQYPTSNYRSNPINPTNQTHPAQADLEGYHQYGAGCPWRL